MNFQKKIVEVILIFLSILIMFGCNSNIADGTTGKVDQTSFSAGADQSKLTTDSNFTQSATGVQSSTPTTYSSSNSAVVTVNSSSGEVDIIGKGTATITAINPGDDSYNLAEDSYSLTVKNPFFITTWKTTSANESITVPHNSSYTYNYSVDWGDGHSDSTQNGDATHTYVSAGTYTVKISGTFPLIYFNNAGDKDKIYSIENWGIIEWESMASSFFGCSNLTYNATDNPNLSNVTSFSMMFFNAISFNGDLNSWDVSTITNMSKMFYHATAFNGNLSTWDVSNVTTMFEMFYNATGFNGDLSRWNVSNVTTMQEMFYNASGFTNHDLSGWNVVKVTNHTDFSSGSGAGNTEPTWP